MLDKSPAMMPDTEPSVLDIGTDKNDLVAFFSFTLPGKRPGSVDPVNFRYPFSLHEPIIEVIEPAFA